MQTAFRVFQKSYNQQNTTVVSTLIWTREICRLRDTFYTLTDLISHPVIIIDGISLFTDLMQKCSNKSWEATNNTQRLSTCRVEQCCLIRTAPENLRRYSYQKWSCILQYYIMFKIFPSKPQERYLLCHEFPFLLCNRSFYVCNSILWLLVYFISKPQNSSRR